MKVLPVAALLLLAIFSLASAIPANDRYRRNPVGYGNETHVFEREPSLRRHRRAAGTCEAEKELKEVVEKQIEDNGRKKRYIIDVDKALDRFDTFETEIAETQFKNTLKRLVEREGAELTEGERMTSFFETFDLDMATYDRAHPPAGSDGARPDFGARPGERALNAPDFAAMHLPEVKLTIGGMSSGQLNGPIFRYPNGKEIKHGAGGKNIEERFDFRQNERPGFERESGIRDPFGSNPHEFYRPGEVPNGAHMPDFGLFDPLKFEAPKVEIAPEIRLPEIRAPEPHIELPRPIETFHPVDLPLFRLGGRGG